MATEQVRYDPIWRRIKADDYARKLEGKFPDLRDRLGALNNWGSLAWLYPHATATKLAHHYGLEHNACQFLACDEARDKYRPSFRIAAHALHWGHIPLSYAGAEAVARASHVDANASKIVAGIVDDVVEFGSLDCAKKDHAAQCAEGAKTGERPFELYKWLAAWQVSRRWKTIWQSVGGLAPSDVTESRVKRETIRTLVCQADFGYELLGLCNLADYVPRDLQQAGTAWLTVDIEALWEISPLRPDAAQEWSLLRAARDYLEDRFFKSPEAQLLHSLAARVIAQGLLTRGVTREELLTLLGSGRGDSHYESTFGDYYRRRLRRVRTWAESGRLVDTWDHIGTFRHVSVPDRGRLEIEDMFTGRTGKGRLSYPLTADFSVVVEDVEPDRAPVLAGSDRRYVTVHLHRRGDSTPVSARPALDIACRVNELQGPFETGVPAGLMGWFTEARIEQRPLPVQLAAGRLLTEDDATMRKSLQEMRDRKSLKSINNHALVRLQVGTMLGPGPTRPLQLGRLTVALPWSAASSAAGTRLLEKLRELGITLAASNSGARGAGFEAAIAADQWLSTDTCEDRLVFVGATALSGEGVPVAEWDVVRVDLIRGGDWRLVAIECALNPDTAKVEKDREKLDELRKGLQGRFADLEEYRTRFATLKDGALHYDDAARGFVRT